MNLDLQKSQNRVLRIKELLVLIGISRSTICQWIKLGKFPRPIKIGGSSRCVGWYLFDIGLWFESFSCE